MSRAWWLYEAELERKHPEVSEVMWQVELQEPSPKDRAIHPDAVTEMFWSELGGYEGWPESSSFIEEPELHEDGGVADWAGKQDSLDHILLWFYNSV